MVALTLEMLPGLTMNVLLTIDFEGPERDAIVLLTSTKLGAAFEMAVRRGNA